MPLFITLKQNESVAVGSGTVRLCSPHRATVAVEAPPGVPIVRERVAQARQKTAAALRWALGCVEHPPASSYPNAAVAKWQAEYDSAVALLTKLEASNS